MGVVMMDWNVFAVFGSIALVLVAALYLNYRGRRAVADTIREVVEKANLSDPQLATELLRQLTARPSDLRRGGLFLAVALAFVIMAFVLDQPEAVRPMIGVAAFPGMLGFAYLIFHYLSVRRPS